jgi:hypothetical protein
VVAGDKTASNSVATELWLPPGRHNVAVKAETEDSVGLSDPIEVTRGPAAGQPKPKLQVLAIGGGSDAAALAGALAAVAPRDVDAPQPRILQGKVATPEAIVSELERLRKESTLADTTFIYIAGAESLDRGGQYQLSATDEPQEALSGNDLKRLLAPIPGRIVLATDLKRSEQKMDRQRAQNFCGDNTAEKSNRLDAAADDFFRELLTEDYGVIVMRTQTPGATIGSSGGASFSKAISEAVAGKADEDGDGVLQFSELSRYVPKRVRELSGGKQSTAVGQPQGVGPFPIAQPAGR